MAVFLYQSIFRPIFIVFFLWNCEAFFEMLCFVGEQEANVLLYKIARVRRLIRSLVVLIELLCLDKACKQAIVFAKH